MDPLDLNVEQGIAVDLAALSFFDIVGQTLFVGQLAVVERALEFDIVCVLLEAFEEHAVGQIIVGAERLGDQGRQAGVGLQEPSSESDAVRDIGYKDTQ
jgi:hypothetical protein